MKKIIYANEKEFMKEAFMHIKNGEVLLDVGCGIRPHTYACYDYYIACEPFDGYIKVLKENRAKNDSQVYANSCMIILNDDWKTYLDKYDEYSVDTVYLIDVIEHLNKDEGRELLRRTEKIAKKQVVIFTPLEYIEQKALPGGKDAWGLDGVDWQEHKSVWTPEDFDGDEWEFVICEDFHKFNNIGEKLSKPVGAFWAIKNSNNKEEMTSILDCDGMFNRDQELIKILMRNKIKISNSLKEEKEAGERARNKIASLELELDNIKKSRGYVWLEKSRQYRDLVKGWFNIK